jgi:hypothetical protein
VPQEERPKPQDPKPPRVDPEKITKGGNPDKGERRDK